MKTTPNTRTMSELYREARMWCARAVLLLAIGGWTHAAVAQTFISDSLKRLSYFLPAVMMFESFRNGLNAEDQGTVKLEALTLESIGSILKVRQSFQIDETTKNDQVWLIVGRENDARAFRPVHGLTVLFCDATRVLILWHQPIVNDLDSPCHPLSGGEIDGYEPASVTGIVQLIDLESTNNAITYTYELNSYDRWIELSEKDARSVYDLVTDDGFIGFRMDWLDMSPSLTEPELLSIVVRTDLYREHIPELPSNGQEIVGELIPFDPEFELSDDWEGPSFSHIKNQLEPTYNLLMTSFGLPQLDEVLKIYRRFDNPRVHMDYENGKKVQFIGLNTRRYYFQQYTYQFAHELGHVLTNWERKPNRDLRYSWFEETLAELASAFTIRAYEANPPAVMGFTSESWSNYFDSNYTNGYSVTLESNWSISSTQPVKDWFYRLNNLLTNDCCIRELNWAVAREMLPSFVEDPTLWHAASYINHWDTTSDIDFYDYLESWRNTLIRERIRTELVDLMFSIIPEEPVDSNEASRIAPINVPNLSKSSSPIQVKVLHETTPVGQFPGASSK